MCTGTHLVRRNDVAGRAPQDLVLVHHFGRQRTAAARHRVLHLVPQLPVPERERLEVRTQHHLPLLRTVQRGDEVGLARGVRFDELVLQLLEVALQLVRARRRVRLRVRLVDLHRPRQLRHLHSPATAASAHVTLQARRASRERHAA